jgi:hypothetical protein
MGATSLVSKDVAHEQTWRIDLLPWNANRPEAFAGLHNKGRRILLIFDEASAIAPEIWETCEAVATDSDAEVIWLAMGNPLHAVGRFRDCFEKFEHRWVTKHVNSLDVSFVNKGEMRKWIADYGEDSDFVRSRILGQFPRTGSDQFISPAAVDAAMGRELVPSHNDQLVCGIDVARYGSDASVVYFRKGHDARSIPPAIYRGLSIAELEDRVVMLCNQYRPTQLMIDGGGVGGGLVDHLRRRNFLVHDIQFGSRADQGIDGVRYANKRAEMYGILRRSLDYLALPMNQELKENLTCFEYAFNQRGEILLESKDSLRRRGVSSPDISDALATTYACEVATLPALSEWVGPQGILSEYNPLSSENLEAGMLGRPLVEAGARSYVAGWARLKPEFEGGWSRQDHIDAWASDAVTHRDYKEGWE